jgi:hypothetical protein
MCRLRAWLIGLVAATLSAAPIARGTAYQPSPKPGSPQPYLQETVERPTSVASYGGWAAWSRYDASRRGYRLVMRNPNGGVAAMEIAESPAPFEVGLGPSPSGAVAAVYPRCTNAVSHRGCRLEQLAVESTSAREQPLTVPGGGSVFRPALWKGTIAFLRLVPKGGETHPVEMFEWTSGSRHLAALPLPRNSLFARAIRERRELRGTEGYVGNITSLALRGTQVAYTRVAPWGEWDISNLWVQRPGQRPRLIDSIETGGGAMFGTRTYLTPTFSGSWLDAYRQYHERHLGDGDPGWVRYSLTSNTAQQAQVDLGHREGPGENEGTLDAAVPLGEGVLWTLQTSGAPEKQEAQVLSLASVTWKSIKRRRHPV